MVVDWRMVKAATRRLAMSWLTGVFKRPDYGQKPTFEFPKKRQLDYVLANPSNPDWKGSFYEQLTEHGDWNVVEF